MGLARARRGPGAEVTWHEARQEAARETGTRLGGIVWMIYHAWIICGQAVIIILNGDCIICSSHAWCLLLLVMTGGCELCLL